MDRTAAVVIPTYNERGTVPAVIDELLTQECVSEIIIVDDDSPDRTGEIVAQRYTQDSVTVIIRREASGLASAVQRGFAEAEAAALVCMDGDGQHPPETVPDLVDGLSKADVAVGSRHVGGRNHADWSLTRVAMSFGASSIAWLAVPDSRPLQDPMSGFFAVRRSVYASAADRLAPVGYKILLEVIARCPVSEIAEVPITFEERHAGESNTDWRENVRFLRHMGRLAVATRRRTHPVRIPDEEVRDVRH